MFLVCSQWPKCRVSGTPELLERFAELNQRPNEPPAPAPAGEFIRKLALLRIAQSQLRRATTLEEREQIRNQAQEVLR